MCLNNNNNNNNNNNYYYYYYYYYYYCNTLENSYGIKTKPKFNFRDKLDNTYFF